MFLKLSKQKNTVSTDVFCASEDQNHGIYDFTVFFLPHGMYTVFGCQCLAETLVFTHMYAVQTMLQDVVSMCQKDKNTVFYDVFASRRSKKIVKKLFKNGPKSNSKSILPVVPHKAVAEVSK